jgi:propanol-preferring alcohol dehydrogenase
MPDTMRAVVIANYGGSLQATRRPVPRPGPGEVLVRVRASGLCSTDLHLLSGRQPLGDLPRIVGHELAGDVVELGNGVTHWRQGDRVTAAIDVTCGRCRHCLAGETQLCRAMKRIGFERDGGHADYVAVPEANLVALHAEISYEAAAILPDAVACMYHSLIHQGGVGIGQRILILGVGGLGIHGVQIAKSVGAEVLATSRRQQRVTLAEQYGAVGINTAHESLEAAVARFTDGEGVDVVVDNIGTRASVRQGLTVLRPGGKFLVVAYLDETFEVPSMPLFKTELEIIGCRGSTKQDLIDVVRLVRAGLVTPVLGASYALDQIQEAAARLESGDLVGRIWLTRA